MILERDYANHPSGMKPQESYNSSLYNPKYMATGTESEGFINLHASSKEIIRQTDRPVDLKYCSVLKNKNERDRQKIFGSVRLPWGCSDASKEGITTSQERDDRVIKERIRDL